MKKSLQFISGSVVLAAFELRTGERELSLTSYLCGLHRKPSSRIAAQDCEAFQLGQSSNVEWVCIWRCDEKFLELCELADHVAVLNDSKTRTNTTETVKKVFLRLGLIEN